MQIYEYRRQYEAQEMTKAGYCELRGWHIPPDEDPTEIGFYLVDGDYHTWMPKTEFLRYAKKK